MNRIGSKKKKIKVAWKNNFNYVVLKRILGIFKISQKILVISNIIGTCVFYRFPASRPANTPNSLGFPWDMNLCFWARAWKNSWHPILFIFPAGWIGFVLVARQTFLEPGNVLLSPGVKRLAFHNIHFRNWLNRIGAAQAGSELQRNESLGIN